MGIEENMGVPNSNEKVIPDEEKNDAENLEKEGEINPVEEPEEKPDGIEEKKGIIGELKKKIAGVQEEIGKVRKQRKEVKEGKEILSKEEKEKIEKEREEAKERINELASEMKKNIKSHEGTTIAQHEKLIELGKNPKIDLADDVLDRLSYLEQETHNSFLKDLDELTAQVKLWEYNKDGYKVKEEHLDPTKERLRKLSEIYERTLGNLKDSKKALEKYTKKEHPEPEGFLDDLVTKK